MCAAANVTDVPDALATSSSSQLPTFSIPADEPCRLMSKTSSPVARQPPLGVVASGATVGVSAVTLYAGESAHVRLEIDVGERFTLVETVTGARHVPRSQAPVLHAVPSGASGPSTQLSMPSWHSITPTMHSFGRVHAAPRRQLGASGSWAGELPHATTNASHPIHRIPPR